MLKLVIKRRSYNYYFEYFVRHKENEFYKKITAVSFYDVLNCGLVYDSDREQFYKEFDNNYTSKLKESVIYVNCIH